MSQGEHPWTLLGIAPTNDARAIRKAYATKLRVTRPDEDPEGFQRLVAARDWALAMSHQPVFAAHDDVEMEPERPAPSTVDADGHVPILINNIAPLAPAEPDVAEAAAETSHVLQLLATLEASPAGSGLTKSWGAIFDALEQSSLQEFDYLTWSVLNRLVDDLQRDVSEIPDVAGWGMEATASDKARLGDYGDVLRDLENRFHFLGQDTRLFDYLDYDQAQTLINALTIAAGRIGPMEANGSPGGHVAQIGGAFVALGFGNDVAMQGYYERARKAGHYPWSFSILALLFPPVFAFNYRLYRTALLSAAVLAALIAILEFELPLVPLALGFHVIIAVSLSLRWRGMRVEALARKMRYLMRKGYDGPTVRNKLAAWGTENRIWWPVFCVLALMAKVGAFHEIARFFTEFK